MSVVGLDVGNESCLIGVERQRGIEVILNDECWRATPSMVSFSEKQRFIGTGAASTATMNPRNTVSQIKRFIGRKYRDPELQKDIRDFPFPFQISEAPDGGSLITVDHLGERTSFTPTQILGMMLSNLKRMAERALGNTVVDCVMGIPAYFTELQRRAYLDAASIAGLHPLRLMHETTATALLYGIFKPDLMEDTPFNVVFIDVGHASTQVCVAAFMKGQLRILSHAFDRCLGGRDFDKVLFNHFALKCKRDLNLDVFSNIRATQRLYSASEKLKKILSANMEASLNIECLLDEKDLNDHMTREDFEGLTVDLVERVKIPCIKALELSGLTPETINAVEVVGSASRMPAIRRAIASIFTKEPCRTLNASESVARGCALQCAIMSPSVRVRDFEVHDSFPFPISLTWKDPSVFPTADPPNSTTCEVFERGHPFPCLKLLTYQRSPDFAMDVCYSDSSELPAGTPLKISTYQIGPLVPSMKDKATLKVKVGLNIHGISSVDQATLLHPDKEDPQLKEASMTNPDALPMDTDHDRKSTVTKIFQETSMGSRFVASIQNWIEHEPQETNGTDIPVQGVVFGGVRTNELQKIVEEELKMAQQDRVMEETKEKKNAVEAYVYDMRNKLSETLREFVTEIEREHFNALLQQTEFWLYEDGEDESKGVYVAKLAELKQIGDPFIERQREAEAREHAIKDLMLCINSYREIAKSQDSSYDFISQGDKEKVFMECKKVEEWIKAKKQTYGAEKMLAQVFSASDIRTKHESLDTLCKALLNKATLDTVPGGEMTGTQRHSCCGDSHPCSGTR